MAFGLFFFPALPHGQVPFEQALTNLKSPHADVRLDAVRLLKDAAYPEAAVPLAALIVDPENDVQLEAIAAELNIFLTTKVKSSRRIGLVIEVRNKVLADAAFAAGPFALDGHPVPIEVPRALQKALHDDSPRVAVEALYAFGALAPEAGGAARRDLLKGAAPDLAALLGSLDPDTRLAALRVIARVFERRRSDDPADQPLGDAVITELNDKVTGIRLAAMQALGSIRYERSVQALMSLFDYYGKGVMAEAALDALAHIAHPSTVPLLTAQLRGKNALLKSIAIEGLARLGDPTRTPDVQASLASERADTVLLAGHFYAVSVTKGSLDPIVEQLARTRLHNQAFEYLRELAPGRARQLAPAAQDPNARVREDVLNILGVSSDAAALPIVEPLLKDRDPDVARTAQRALARLRAL